jgi:sec-independent protein translocase protein TatB
MFLFILDSIGTSELILIGIIALMFLGPRKLPEIAKKIGKTMADFRNTTNEFKATWQREVDFEDEIRAIRTGDLPDEPATVPRADSKPDDTNTIAAPSVKPAQAELFADSIPEQPTPEKEAQPETETVTTDDPSDKRNWL